MVVVASGRVCYFLLHSLAPRLEPSFAQMSYEEFAGFVFKTLCCPSCEEFAFSPVLTRLRSVTTKGTFFSASTQYSVDFLSSPPSPPETQQKLKRHNRGHK